MRSRRAPALGRRRLRTDRLIALAVAVVLLPVVASLGTPAQAMAPTPVFAPYVNYSVPGTRGVAVADFTGDGRNDVAVSARAGDAGNLHVFGQGADGWFAQIDTMAAPVDYAAEGGMATGDFDRDGHADLALATGHSVALFLQRAGTLVLDRELPVVGAEHVVVSEVDRDSWPDLVVKTKVNPIAGEVVVLWADGLGGYGPPAVVVGELHTEVQVGDVTGDGRPDIVTCALGQVLVFAQTNLRGFTAPVSHAGDVWCQGLTLGDLDGDDLLDIAFAGGGNVGTSRVDVLAQRPDGTLGPAVTYRSSDIPDAVVTGDMNGDGRTDLVVAHEAFRQVGVYAQAPDHSLDPERLYGVGRSGNSSPKRMVVGDVNGDGRTDIVKVGVGTGLLVLWNQAPGPSTTTSTSVWPTTSTTTPTPGVPPRLFAPYQAFDVSSNADSLATGDFNSDGRTDIAMATAGHSDPPNDHEVFVFYQGPAGSLAKMVRYDTDGGGDMVLDSGDLDGDGRTDLVLRFDTGINVFLQRDGGFADRKFHELPHAHRVDVADLDEDGVGELIMTGSQGIRIYRSLGGTAFAPPVVVTEAYHYDQLGVDDVTGDGRLDLVSTTDGPRAIEVFAQLPDGSFAEHVVYPLGEMVTDAIGVGDLTGDGRADVAVGSYYGDQVQVLAQTADGSLAVPVTYAPRRPDVLRVADIDGDGRDDLVLARGGSVGVMLQQPDGRLAPEKPFDVPHASFLKDAGLAVTDLTGDGRPEVAVAAYDSGLAVLRNQGPAQPTAQAVRYVERLVGELLGRPPTAAELATWAWDASAPAARVGLAVTLVSSREYRLRRVTQEAQARLGHAPIPAQAAALVDAMAAGAIVEIAAALFLGSDEFYVRSGSTPEGFVDALFLDVFGLKPDPASRAALAGVVRAGYSRIGLAVLVLVHPGARARLVDLAYQRHLGHAPDGSMRAWWVDNIGYGVRSEYLIAYLLSTDEYFDNVG